VLTESSTTETNQPTGDSSNLIADSVKLKPFPGA
jgi:hypothetical protein